MIHQLALFPAAPDAAAHGWLVVCEEDQDGIPGYRLRHTRQTGPHGSAWVPAHEWEDIVFAWDRGNRGDVAPGEL